MARISAGGYSVPSIMVKGTSRGAMLCFLNFRMAHLHGYTIFATRIGVHLPKDGQKMLGELPIKLNCKLLIINVCDK